MSLKSLRKVELQLATWQTLMLTNSGRLILVQNVLTAIACLSYALLDIPSWVIKCIKKICWSFLWYGADDAEGGHCLAAWEQMRKLKSLGGLGMHNLKYLNAALRMRW
jgi:hypothetical protein